MSGVDSSASADAEDQHEAAWGSAGWQPLLTPERARLVYRAITRKCLELGCDVIGLGGVEDHVHLLVRMRATISAAELAKHVKGAASYRANPRHGDKAEFRWQGGYAAFSLSPQHVERIRNYVLHQPEHHRRGTVVPALEPVVHGNEERAR